LCVLLMENHMLEVLPVRLRIRKEKYVR